jgi:anti-sigma B factor antagonist
MDDRLTIGVRRGPGCVIVTAAGEIDIFTVARLREVLLTLADSGQPVIADLDQVTFLGAAGLGALAGAARRAAARGTSLHLACARPQTRQLIQLTGLDRTLRLARTRADALQALPAGPAPQPVPAPPGGDDD